MPIDGGVVRGERGDGGTQGAAASCAAKPQGYRHPRSLAAHREWLLERLTAKPDVTLRGLVAELGERGVVTSYGSVWRIVREAGVTFKKRR